LVGLREFAGDGLCILLSTTHPESGQHLSDRNIRHQILTFLLAGHETTSGALSFRLHPQHEVVLVLARLVHRYDITADPC